MHETSKYKSKYKLLRVKISDGANYNVYQTRLRKFGLSESTGYPVLVLLDCIWGSTSYTHALSEVLLVHTVYPIHLFPSSSATELLLLVSIQNLVFEKFLPHKSALDYCFAIS